MSCISSCGIWRSSRAKNGSGQPTTNKASKAQGTLLARPVTSNKTIRTHSVHSIVTPSSSTPVPTASSTRSQNTLKRSSSKISPQQPVNPATGQTHALTDLWQKAIATLDDNERVGLATSNASMTARDIVDEMIILATKRQQQCEKSQWKTFTVCGSEISLSDTASKIIIWLNKFKEIGDIIVQADPVHAAIPWAIARFVLQAIIVTKEQMAASLAIMERVARIVHRCQVFQELYNRNTLDQAAVENLESALIKLYASILRALLEMNKMLSKSAHTKSLYAVFHPDMGSSLLDSLEKGEILVDREVKACEGQRRAKVDARIEEQLRGLLELREPVLRIDKNVKQVLQSLEVAELTRVLIWISPIEYRRHHDAVRELRTKDTCDWLLQRPKFVQWSSATSSITLWLQGFPGAGKTYLTSKVIEETQATLKGTPNDEGFAFFYCNRNEENRRNAFDVLLSYVRQLSTTAYRSGLIHSELKQLYDSARLSGSGWTFSSCQDYLIKLLNLYPRTVLILDALDECHSEERTNLLDFFDSIPSKSSKPVRIFISSRPEGDIQQRLSHLSTIEIQATDNGNDIAKFVRQNIERNGRWNDVLRKDQPLKDEIIRTLLTQSNGMFQWAYLQIKQLLDLRTKHQIIDRLGKLPKDLEAAYDQIYENIEALDAHSKAVSLRALKWIACAYEPLTNEELLAAVHVDPEEGFQESFEATEADILDWCANLIRVDSQHYPPVWRVSHLSVVEYFEKRWKALEAHCFVAKASLALLLQDAPGDEQGDSPQPTSVFHPDHELQVYVRYFWARHVQTQESQVIDPELASLLKKFFGSLEQSSAQYRRWHGAFAQDWLKNSDGYFIHFSDISPSTSPASLACCFSFYNLLRDWWDAEPLQVSQLTTSGNNLLCLAAVAGCKPLCIRLCEAGISVDEQLQDIRVGSALAATVMRGNIEIVQLLIDRRANINMPLQYGQFGSALAAAAAGENIEIVQLLIDEGADVNMQVQYGTFGSALVSAAIHINVEIARLLIDRRANVNMPLEYKTFGSALAAAAAYDNTREIVQLLIEKGADVNLPLQTGDFSSALAVAVLNNNNRIVRILVDNGADVDMPLQKGDFGSALAAAAHLGLVGITKILVANNADITIHLQNGLYRTALEAARAPVDGKYWAPDPGAREKRKSEVVCFLESSIETLE
ncbi:hypothetical protein F4859DRAFT_476136 [Xylaria cf. heliscus]|nr:hypothetical protein F4859DRAFT_476136 [Xylaria cf. heliscus]